MLELGGVPVTIVVRRRTRDDVLLEVEFSREDSVTLGVDTCVALMAPTLTGVVNVPFPLEVELVVRGKMDGMSVTTLPDQSNHSAVAFPTAVDQRSETT